MTAPDPSYKILEEELQTHLAPLLPKLGEGGEDEGKMRLHSNFPEVALKV
jgi:hypothetical protein